MELKNERYKDVVEYDIDLSETESKVLVEMGLKLIAEDKNELINYAINHILRDLKNELESGNETLKTIIEKMKKKGKPADVTEKRQRRRPRKVIS